jgi:hypothetical protein
VFTHWFEVSSMERPKVRAGVRLHFLTPTGFWL